MEIPKTYEAYFEKLPQDGMITLKDAQTKLYLKALKSMYIVQVVRGIVRNIVPGVRKSDYLSYGIESGETHLIECVRLSCKTKEYFGLNKWMRIFRGSSVWHRMWGLNFRPAFPAPKISASRISLQTLGLKCWPGAGR